jgi:hypothetical protein
LDIILEGQTMKNLNNKSTIFTAAAAVVFAAAPADAANIGRNLPPSCQSFVANCQNRNPNPELCQFLFGWAQKHNGDWATPDALGYVQQQAGHSFKRPPRYNVCTL